MGGASSPVIRVATAAVTLGGSEAARAGETISNGGTFDDFATGNNSQIQKAQNRVDPILGTEHAITDPSKRAKKAAEDQQAAAAKLSSDAAATQAARDSDAAAIQARDDARRRQRALSGTARRDTLLTGPSGLADSSSGQRKTLLGA